MALRIQDWLLDQRLLFMTYIHYQILFMGPFRPSEPPAISFIAILFMSGLVFKEGFEAAASQINQKKTTT